MSQRLALCAASLLGPLAAQGAPTFCAKADAMAVLRIDDIPALAAALPQTHLGRLFAEADVAAAWATGVERLRRSRAVAAEVRQTAVGLKIEVQPWLAANTALALFWSALDHVDLTDVRDAAMAALPDAGDGRFPQPRTLTVVRCTPRVEGKATQRFEAAARDLERSGWMLPVADAKVDGFPAHTFDCKPPDDEQDLPFAPIGVWMVHLPGTFAFGTGKAGDCGAVGPAPAVPAGVTCTFDMAAYLGMLAHPAMGRMPPGVAASGLDALRSLQWRVRLHGESVREELEVAFAQAPTGLLGSLFAGAAPLPAQALPKGALLQLRLCCDLPMLLATFEPLVGASMLDAALRDEIATVLTGGLAIGVAAPAPGGVVPRLFATLGIRDEAAAAALLGKLLGPAAKEATHDGNTFLVLNGTGMPPALQPTFCVRGSSLHVAESVASMRALLAAQADGGDAMAIGDTKVPEGPGTVHPGFDLRWDEAAIYRAFHGVWLPLFELAMPQLDDSFRPLLSREDLPDPDVVAPHLGARRGVLVRGDTTWVLRTEGTFGGPELAALAMTWGPMLSGRFHNQHETEELGRTIARQRLDAAWLALQAFRELHKRWPSDLGELFVAAKLPADALLVPGDDKAEVVAMPEGHAAVRTSFRYYAAAVDVALSDGSVRALLVEVRSRPYARLMLAEDGSIPDVYGQSSSLPIDKIGK